MAQTAKRTAAIREGVDREKLYQLEEAVKMVKERAKAKFDETIEVVTSCGELRGASLDMIQQARRGGETLVRAELLVACMGASGRPVRLPPHLRTALAQVSSGGSPRSRHIRV